MKGKASFAIVVGFTALTLVGASDFAAAQRPTAPPAQRPGASSAQRPAAPPVARPNLGGRWTLNRGSSQLPTDVGFGLDLGNAGKDVEGAAASGGGVFFRESEEEARRREQLVEDVRNPSPHLIIAQTETFVTLSDDRGRSLTFHPDGREEAQSLDDIPLVTIAKWVNGRLEVRYKVAQGRELRYTYGRTMEPPQLVVQVQFVERGAKDILTRVYDPSKPGEPTQQEARPGAAQPGGQAAGQPPGGANKRPGLVDSGLLRQPPAGAPPLGGGGASPAVPGSTGAPAVPRGPDPELRGLSTVGIVVEDLSSQAAGCGLKQETIEAAAAKSLTDAGLKVSRNSDEDTYLYVQVITTSAPNLCVSRYDVSLFTHATTTLSYQAAPMLVRVALLQKGGLAGGPPATHGDAVTKTVKQYADEMAARIRDANK